MKHQLLSLLLLTLLAFGCDRVTPLPEPVVEAPLVQLNYDGANQTAPLFGSGTFEGAVRFTPAELSGLDGKSLTEVIFYVLQEPRSATIKVYEGTANAAPVDLVQSFAVGADIQAGSWNRISLPNPRQIDATKDLWIAFRFDNQVNGQVLGCDRGPAAPYGDYLFDNSDGLWQKLSTRTANGININWNLRAVVE